MILSAFAPLGAQQRKASAGPRALGLFVVPSGPSKKPLKPFLIPIALWYQNRYFDAQLYGARPEPMALDGGVVYEVRKGGDALGLFTVDSIAQQENKRWLGGGTYQTMKEIEARATARRERNRAPTETVKDDGPPRLRRSGESRSASSPPKPDTTAPASTSPSTAPAPTASAPAAQPPAPAAKPEPTPAAKAPAEASDDDPDRPRLHRAPGGEPQTIAPNIKPAPATTSGPAKSATTAAAATNPAPVPTSPAPEVYVAISDAHTIESRPYDFTWGPQEQETYKKAVEQMASTAIDGFLQRRYHVQPATPEPPRTAAQRSKTGARTRPAAPAPAPSAMPLENVQVRALDVTTDNYPEVVLTGQRTAQVPGPEGGSDQRTFYVTIVVRVDTLAVDRRDQFRQLFSQVTDDRHMDELPRLQLIDVVDADGDGIGELLFRETFSPTDEQNPSAWGFQLFRVGVDRLEKLYDSEGKIE